MIPESILLLCEQIAKPFESCRLSAYWDCAGYPTNGWGNLLRRITKKQVMDLYGFTSQQADIWLHETWPDITQQEADEKLTINLGKAFASTRRLVKLPLSDKQTAPIVDMCFNTGAGNVQASTLLRCVNRNELDRAADEFLRWNKAGGIVQRGLTRRCIVRRSVFLSGT